MINLRISYEYANEFYMMLVTLQMGTVITSVNIFCFSCKVTKMELRLSCINLSKYYYILDLYLRLAVHELETCIFKLNPKIIFYNYVKKKHEHTTKYKKMYIIPSRLG